MTTPNDAAEQTIKEDKQDQGQQRLRVSVDPPMHIMECSLAENNRCFPLLDINNNHMLYFECRQYSCVALRFRKDVVSRVRPAPVRF